MTSVPPRVARLWEVGGRRGDPGCGRRDLRRHQRAPESRERSTGLMGIGIPSGRRPAPRDPRRLPCGGPIRPLHRRYRSIGATLVLAPERHLPGRDPGPRRGPTSAVPVAVSPDSSEPWWRLRSSHRVAHVVSHPRRTSQRHRRRMGFRSPTRRPRGLLAVLRRSAVCPWMVHQAEAVPTRPIRRQAVCARICDETTTHRIRRGVGHLLRAAASSPSPPRFGRLRRGHHASRPPSEPRVPAHSRRQRARARRAKPRHRAPDAPPSTAESLRRQGDSGYSNVRLAVSQALILSQSYSTPSPGPVGTATHPSAPTSSRPSP